MNGLKLEDIARFEVGGALAALVNTRPVTFWMLLLIFMTPGLLSDIRQEIDSNIKIFDNQASLDITALKENCPLMTSTYREVLRYRTIGTSVRRVMEDTVLNGQFFQEKNAMVQSECFDRRSILIDKRTLTGLLQFPATSYTVTRRYGEHT